MHLQLATCIISIHEYFCCICDLTIIVHALYIAMCEVGFILEAAFSNELHNVNNYKNNCTNTVF